MDTWNVFTVRVQKYEWSAPTNCLPFYSIGCSKSRMVLHPCKRMHELYRVPTESSTRMRIISPTLHITKKSTQTEERTRRASSIINSAIKSYVVWSKTSVTQFARKQFSNFCLLNSRELRSSGSFSEQSGEDVKFRAKNDARGEIKLTLDGQTVWWILCKVF